MWNRSHSFHEPVERCLRSGLTDRSQRVSGTQFGFAGKPGSWPFADFLGTQDSCARAWGRGQDAATRGRRGGRRASPVARRTRDNKRRGRRRRGAGWQSEAEESSARRQGPGLSRAGQCAAGLAGRCGEVGRPPFRGTRPPGARRARAPSPPLGLVGAGLGSGPPRGGSQRVGGRGASEAYGGARGVWGQEWEPGERLEAERPFRRKLAQP